MANGSERDDESPLLSRETIISQEVLTDGRKVVARLDLDCHENGAVIVFEEGDQVIVLPPGMRRAIQDLWNDLYDDG